MKTAETDVAQALGPDLARLISGVDVRFVAATRITGLRAAARDRATFRLRFAGGLVLKGRRMDSVADAERAYSLGSMLDGRSFTRPMARHRTALLEPWVTGTRLDPEVATDDTLRACGRLLGSVHALDVDVNGEAQRWHSVARLANVEQRLAHLRELTLLPRGVESCLRDRARETCPSNVVVGMVHRDLWPRNVVVDAQRRPHVVDNASIAIGAHAFDWARTAYLWPMTGAQRDAFRAGYLAAAPRAADESVFWMIDVLSDAALFRRLAGARGVSRPVARLRAIAEAG